jgi:glycosyltransferase involved in cell wall biosynthesis
VRILQVITPWRYSGAERVCVEMAAELKLAGHDVEVATKPNGQLHEALADYGVPCHTLRISGKLNLATPFRIARLARRTGAEVIHTHLSTASFWAPFAGRLIGVPVVSHVHALNSAKWYRRATRIIAVADAVKEHLVSEGLPADRIDVVHNAVDIAHGSTTPSADEVRARLGVEAAQPLIIVTAHLSRKKGHHVLLRALALQRQRRPELRCYCLGDGPELRNLKLQAQRLGLDGAVQFLGFRSDARELMRAADIVALPSVRGEGLPLCLLEAAALGKPIVASRLSGIPEIVVDGQTGYVVEPNSPEALAARFEALIGDPGARRQMGAAAKAHAFRFFRRDQRAAAVLEVYSKALAAPLPSGSRRAGW